MEFNYRLYSSFLISTLIHLTFILICSLILLPKIPIPPKPLEINIVEVTPPKPREEKQKKITFTESKKEIIKRIKEKPVKIPVQRFKYSSIPEEAAFLNSEAREISVKHTRNEKDEAIISYPADIPLREELAAIEEQKPFKTAKIPDYGGLSQEEYWKKLKKESGGITYTEPLIPKESIRERAFEKIEWEGGITRERIFAPDAPKSHSPITGKVKVLFWVNNSGFVSNVAIEKKLSPEQDQIAMNYVRKFKFRPVSTTDQNERHQGTITIQFENVKY